MANLSPHRVCVVVIILLICGTTELSQENVATSRFPTALRPCKPNGVNEFLLCGKLTVFENRGTKKGRTINLNIIVLPSIGDRRHDPLFDLDGGPGAPDTKNAVFYATEGKQYRQGRDIVLVDQRGTGESNPLNCKPLSTSPSRALDEMYPVEYVKRCRQELETKADLGLYTTEIAMDDLDDVRVWLGYQKIDLFGISYGTRAAQVYVRRHPNSAGQVVLLGAISTYHKMPLYHAPNAQRAMDLLLDECLADKECKAAFPNIKLELTNLIERLRQKPETARYVDTKTGSIDEMVIRADEFAEKLRNRLYSRGRSQDIPFIVHQAATGNFKPFLDRVRVAAGSLSFLSDGLYLSVTCAEDVPFINEAEASKLSKNNVFGEYRVFQQRRACQNWVRGKISPEFLKPVRSDVPLLVLSGTFDPVTPPSWGTEIVRRFKNGRQIVFPALAHEPDGVSNADCLDNIALAFLSGTPADKVDDTCTRNMLPGPFLISEPATKK